MSNGIFTTLSGATAQEKYLEIIANNLANVHTDGYKEDKATFKVLQSEPDKHLHPPLPPDNFKQHINVSPLIGNDIRYVGFGGFNTDHSQGPLKPTSNPLDMAIDGPSYFVTQSHEGLRYTKDGSFTLGANGVLQTHDGFPVQGQKGGIFLTSPDFKVNEQGEIYQDGKLIDRLKIVAFKDLDLLQKVGNNLFTHNGSEENLMVPSQTRLLQGYKEGSNVNPLKNLTQMILTQRSFEAYQKAMKFHDDQMSKANSLGNVKA